MCAGLLLAAIVPLVNPGFENAVGGVAPGWTKARGWHAERGPGLNGNSAYVYTADGSDCNSRPTQDVKLEPGKRYRVSATVLSDDLVTERTVSGHGMTVLLSWFGKDGKWLGECQAGPAARGKMSDWKVISVVTPDMPPNAVRFQVAPHVTGGVRGTARISDVKIETFEQTPVEFVVADAYRAEAVDGRVRFAATVNLADGVPPEGHSAAFSYVAASGKAASVPGRLVPGGAVAEVNVSDLAYGANPVTCVLSAGGRELGRASLLFSRLRAPTVRRVRIDRLGRTLVDGKPFFPLGMWARKIDPTNLAVYARSPFNCVAPYESMPEWKLDLLDRHGLKTVYPLCCEYGNRAKTDARIRGLVERVKGHPAVLGWYMGDEPPMQAIAELTDRYEMVKKIDDDHPAWITQCVFTDIRHSLTAYDIAGVDPYPVPVGPVSAAVASARIAEENSFGTRPDWFSVQAFGWEWLGRRERIGQRAPTKQEIANMTWQAIAGGAKGIFYYGFQHLDEPHKDPDDTFWPAWSRVVAAAAEVRQYEHVLLSDDPAPLASCDNESVATRGWTKDGRVYVLAVNVTREPQSATLRVPAGLALSAPAEFGPEPCAVSPGSATLGLPPLGYVMLRFGASNQAGQTVSTGKNGGTKR